MSKSNVLRIVGWVLSGLLALMLIGASASGKFTQWEGKAEMFGKLGWTEKLMFNVGIVEVAITMLFLIPRTAFIGSILITAYLGGATAAHVRIGDAFVFPIIMGVIVWVALGFRMPGIFKLAMGSPLAPTGSDTSEV